ncbi:UNVERIFIED_CONTAM: hypothetical protein FKN15_041291 [Acipenser sinensis]
MSRGTGEYRARTKVGSYSESENGMIISGKPVDYKFNTSFKNDTANWTLHWSNLTDYQCNQLETTIVYTAVQFTGILYRNNTADCNLPCIGATQRIRVAVYVITYLNEQLAGYWAVSFCYRPPVPSGIPTFPRGFLVTVQTENGKVEVEEFGETVLSCKYQVEKDPNPRVEWKKIRNRDVSFVYYEGKIVGGFQGRAVMEGASIRIKKAMLLDSGEYRCEVSARQDSRPLGEATVSLTVLVPPDVPSCGIPSSVLTGTVVELTCRDRQGTPPSLYRWYKNGIALPNTPAQDPLFANSSYTLNSTKDFLNIGKKKTLEEDALVRPPV